MARAQPHCVDRRTRQRPSIGVPLGARYSSRTPVRSFPLRDADNRAVLVVHLIPIRRTAHDIFAGSYALLVVTPVTAPRAPSVELMRSLFDLTQSVAFDRSADKN